MKKLFLTLLTVIGVSTISFSAQALPASHNIVDKIDDTEMYCSSSNTSNEIANFCRQKLDNNQCLGKTHIYQTDNYGNKISINIDCQNGHNNRICIGGMCNIPTYLRETIR